MTAFAVILVSLMHFTLGYDMMMRGFIKVNHYSLELLIPEMEAVLP